MLNQLTIQNYILTEYLEVELDEGLTAITGETGAGKSVALDALALALGARADSKTVGAGADSASICAVFDLSGLNLAASWLQERSLANGNECILRRVITREGRSKAWINGSPSTLQDVRELGMMLANIHSQHEHQRLLQKSTHAGILDDWGKLQPLAAEVATKAREWSQLQQQVEYLQANQQQHDAHIQLLQYQFEELDLLSLIEGEVTALEAEQKILMYGEELLGMANDCTALCDGSDDGIGNDISVTSLLQQAIRIIEKGAILSPSLSPAVELLQSAAIQVEEATDEIRDCAEEFEHNPERLALVNERLDQIYLIARKHQVPPEKLHKKQQQIAYELASLTGGANDIEQLMEAMEATSNSYLKLAKKLSRARTKAKKSLECIIESNLTQLGMEASRIEIALQPITSPNTPSQGGLERVELLVATNPGQKPGALNQIASGGELSRISLAIQVAIATTTATPTLVFDEVDSGIGGRTADVVGQLLRELGESTQVICVTHLAQVAAKSHQHLTVEKHLHGTQASTALKTLNSEEQATEIARMLGGIAMTDTSLAHAREMLASVH